MSSSLLVKAQSRDYQRQKMQGWVRQEEIKHRRAWTLLLASGSKEVTTSMALLVWNREEQKSGTSGRGVNGSKGLDCANSTVKDPERFCT